MTRIILLLIFFTSGVQADVLVLIHGYASNAAVWEQSGINRVLTSNGWQRGGIPGIAPVSKKTFYTVAVPAAAPGGAPAGVPDSATTSRRIGAVSARR